MSPSPVYSSKDLLRMRESWTSQPADCNTDLGTGLNGERHNDGTRNDPQMPASKNKDDENLSLPHVLSQHETQTTSPDLRTHRDNSVTTEKGSRNIRQHHSLLHTIRCWWRECLTCTIIFVDLIALVVTAAKWQGKTLEQWSFGVSINAIIAIYTIILRAAAAFVLAEGKI